MLGDLIPMVVTTSMFAMIFGIVYIRSRENMAMIEKGLNPRNKDPRPRPYVNLKWGLLLIGSGLGLLFAYIIDSTVIEHNKDRSGDIGITIGGHHSAPKSNAVVISDTSHNAKDTAARGAIVIADTNDARDDDDNDNDGDDHSIAEMRAIHDENPAIYFALIAIGGGLGLFFSYRIEKKEWLDKKIVE